MGGIIAKDAKALVEKKYEKYIEELIESTLKVIEFEAERGENSVNVIVLNSDIKKFGRCKTAVYEDLKVEIEKLGYVVYGSEGEDGDVDPDGFIEVTWEIDCPCCVKVNAETETTVSTPVGTKRLLDDSYYSEDDDCDYESSNKKPRLL